MHWLSLSAEVTRLVGFWELANFTIHEACKTDSQWVKRSYCFFHKPFHLNLNSHIDSITHEESKTSLLACVTALEADEWQFRPFDLRPWNLVWNPGRRSINIPAPWHPRPTNRWSKSMTGAMWRWKQKRNRGQLPYWRSNATLPAHFFTTSMRICWNLEDELSISQLPDNLGKSINDQNQWTWMCDYGITSLYCDRIHIDGVMALSPLIFSSAFCSITKSLISWQPEIRLQYQLKS
jgi:hypothetical protein